MTYCAFLVGPVVFSQVIPLIHFRSRLLIYGANLHCCARHEGLSPKAFLQAFDNIDGREDLLHGIAIIGEAHAQGWGQSLLAKSS